MCEIVEQSDERLWCGGRFSDEIFVKKIFGSKKCVFSADLTGLWWSVLSILWMGDAY